MLLSYLLFLNLNSIYFFPSSFIPSIPSPLQSPHYCACLWVLCLFLPFLLNYPPIPSPLELSACSLSQTHAHPGKKLTWPNHFIGWHYFGDWIPVPAALWLKCKFSLISVASFIGAEVLLPVGGRTFLLGVASSSPATAEFSLPSALPAVALCANPQSLGCESAGIL